MSGVGDDPAVDGQAQAAPGGLPVRQAAEARRVDGVRRHEQPLGRHAEGAQFVAQAAGDGHDSQQMRQQPAHRQPGRRRLGQVVRLPDEQAAGATGEAATAASTGQSRE